MPSPLKEFLAAGAILIAAVAIIALVLNNAEVIDNFSWEQSYEQL